MNEKLTKLSILSCDIGNMYLIFLQKALQWCSIKSCKWKTLRAWKLCMKIAKMDITRKSIMQKITN